MSQSGEAGVALALVAGERVWIDSEEPLGTIERLSALLELAALAAVISSLWLMSSARWPTPTGLARLAPHAGTIAGLALATRPLTLIVGVRRVARLWPSVLWRSAAAIMLVASLVANAPEWGAVSTWPLGVAFGAEAALCAWRLGITVNPFRWWLSFVTSPLHLGAVGAMIAAVVRLGWRDGLGDAIAYFAILHLLVIIIVVCAWVLDWMRAQQRSAEQDHEERVIAAEHRRSAHWLHDDVSSQIRIISLKVQNELFGHAEVVSLLDDLDHQLRLRQLDELLDSGTPRLAEIIQPYVRNAQTHGVAITAVPTFEDASLVVDADTGRLFARAASIFTTNAMHAGATEIGFEVEHDPDEIRLSVSDDAGGFDLATVPAGRALWELNLDLGEGRVTSQRSSRGTIMTALIAYDGSPTNGQTASR